MKRKKKTRWVWIIGVIAFFSMMSAAYEPPVSPAGPEDISTELTDEEWERVQAIFAEYVGKEITKKPVYCGEWREGRQYKTENYAYGQYLIDMDEDGQVHLVVWVQDKKGSFGRKVVYNRRKAK